MKTRPELTLADCEKISAAATAEARRNKWIVAIAILDDGGHLLHFVRMDGATPTNAVIAVEKGRTAAMSRRTSGSWQERIKAQEAPQHAAGDADPRAFCRSWPTACASARSESRACSRARGRADRRRGDQALAG
jgi:uncharacterized protein GlcG (DUF336 family)